MGSQLREVLSHFETQNTAVSVKQLARQMALEPGVLQGMIDYWVRKGRLRAVGVNGDACTSCGVRGGCPFIVSLPLYYELVTDNAPNAAAASCGCGGSCRPH